MRVVVVGAASAIGESVVEALRHDPDKRLDVVIGLVSALPADPQPNVDWRPVDFSTDELAPQLQGADALVHLATARARTPRSHSAGVEDPVLVARRVLDAAGEMGVRRVVVLSSFAVYSPTGPGHDPVDETWPTEGAADVPIARDAVAIDRLVDDFTSEHQSARIVRIRAGIALGPRARAQFLERLGPLGARLPASPRPPILPGIEGAALPALHHDDLADAIRAGVTRSAAGSYNVALDAPLELAAAAEALGARPLGVPADLAARGAGLAARLLETVRGGEEPPLGGWLALATSGIRLDTTRAREELGWAPVHSLDDALRSTLSGAR